MIYRLARPAMLLLIGLIALALAGCAASPTPADELDRVFEAQVQATAAAHSLGQVAARATSRADATRQAAVASGQATRIAQDALATATTFARDDAATATAQSFQATATTQAAQFTATAQQERVSATTTAQALSVQATQVSAAANAQATRVSASATATVTTAQVLAAQAQAEWDQRLEAGRALFTFGGEALVLIAAAVIVGWGGIRFIDAAILRLRVIRDRNGVPFVILEADAHGRRQMLAPTRQPGAVVQWTPPAEQPFLIESGAVDADTTKRDQAIALMLATHAERGSAAARELLAEPHIRVVDAPPPQLVSPEAQQVIDGEWNALKEQ